MIRQPANDCIGTIKLLDEQQPNHLVRESHSRERNFLTCTVVNFFRESVGAANDKHQSFGGNLLFLLNPRGKFGRAKLLAALVEQNDRIATVDGFKNKFALGLFLLRLAQLASILKFGNNFNVKRGEMFHSSRIIINGCDNILVHRASNHQKCNFHLLVLLACKIKIPC